MPKTAKKPPVELDSAISDLAFALKGPLIVYETSWADSLPKWIRQEITSSRLIRGMLIHKARESAELATDLETVAYLFPASMISPMTRDWTEIYLWLSAKCIRESLTMSEAAKKEVANLAAKVLTLDQERQLHDLQRWLFKQYEKAKLNFRRRTSGDMPEPAGAPYEQCSLFEDAPVQKNPRKEKVHA
jgi:hypothetical protein